MAIWSVCFFDKGEYDEALEILSSVRTYLQAPVAKRPLSLAVFGPPGSGKSHLVREVKSKLEDEFASEYSFIFSELNLTQVSSPIDVHKAVEQVVTEAATPRRSARSSLLETIGS